MSQPSARVVADSISPSGVRLTTIEAKMHRYVLAEFNTHRVFSRNSASSRAIPVAKQIAAVQDDPALPLEWGANKPGMQAAAPLQGEDLELAQKAWLRARDAAVAAAGELLAAGLHKQISNRLLEPFMWHTVIVTSTEWDNFYEQRCSPLAQPEIRACAEAMRTAMHASTPVELEAGQWHTPYVGDDEQLKPEDVLKISSARCARVSYLTHDGIRDTAKDLELYDRLVSAKPMHASPLEHVARPITATEKQLGNLRGWRQLRHDVEVGP
ncbi:FAD-dependent thymidylate synthase [Kineosporia rhizophila]|uniref:FAD-dependent thymidylate synthase n=1 Tax=Kineosporia rhizophila TaxID=84633 RepID=UPI001E5E18E1|nr:FAD-dependent thymidylate synthase [Kineosporia rhizophila]MCE0538068.1 FAD-dependent thymidylate synthase [Kineosporia rhizophila]